MGSSGRAGLKCSYTTNKDKSGERSSTGRAILSSNVRKAAESSSPRGARSGRAPLLAVQPDVFAHHVLASVPACVHDHTGRRTPARHRVAVTNRRRHAQVSRASYKVARVRDDTTAAASSGLVAQASPSRRAVRRLARNACAGKSLLPAIGRHQDKSPRHIESGLTEPFSGSSSPISRPFLFVESIISFHDFAASIQQNRLLATSSLLFHENAEFYPCGQPGATSLRQSSTPVRHVAFLHCFSSRSDAVNASTTWEAANHGQQQNMLSAFGRDSRSTARHVRGYFE